MFMMDKNKFPQAPMQNGGNLSQMIPTFMNGSDSSLGALGGIGGGGFTQGFNSAYNQGGQDNRIDLAPMLSNLIGQGNFARFNTLGGLISPISGGLY
jgi:hypothetical protein